MVTLYDVARQAGVSIATVSRVLHGQGPVRDSTRARVREAIEQLGYVPDGAAQSLARNRKDVIGLVCVEHTGLKPNQYDIESMSLLFYDEVMRGVEARIRERSWSLMVTFLREDETLGTTLPEDEPVQSRLFALSGKVDGLLIGEGVVPQAVVAELSRRLPVVVVAGDTDMRAADVVSADNWSGAHALVTHLVSAHGRRRLFHVDGPATAPDAKARRLAMQAVIDAHPGTVLTGSFSGRFTVHSGGEAAERLLAAARYGGGHGAGAGHAAAGAMQATGAGHAATEAGHAAAGATQAVGATQAAGAGHAGQATGATQAAGIMQATGPGHADGLPDAIVCANDQMAIGLLRTLGARGIRVPEDIAVVGFDDIFPSSLCDPPLTTVHQPMRAIGERACDRLIERITNPSLRPRVEMLPTELVLRESCGCPPGTVARQEATPVAPRKKGRSQACRLSSAAWASTRSRRGSRLP